MKVIIDKDIGRAKIIDRDKTYELKILDADIDIGQVDYRHSREYVVNLKFIADQVIFE